MKLVDHKIRQYIDKLAAKTPTPGGGSVAATLGALGCGLISMVANFTLAKKGFNGYKERSQKALKGSEAIRKKLMELIDKDAQAYDKLSKALKSKKISAQGLQVALKSAAIPPIKVCQNVHKAAALALELAYVGNKSIISDISVAVYALDAAFESGLVNVNTNLEYIKDRRYVLSKTQTVVALHRDIKRLKTEVLSKVKERMFA